MLSPGFALKFCLFGLFTKWDLIYLYPIAEIFQPINHFTILRILTIPAINIDTFQYDNLLACSVEELVEIHFIVACLEKRIFTTNQIFLKLFNLLRLAEKSQQFIKATGHFLTFKRPKDSLSETSE